MRTRYFILYVAYDGKGSMSLHNEVMVRAGPIEEYADVARLERDISEGLAQKRHCVLLNFIPLGPA